MTSSPRTRRLIFSSHNVSPCHHAQANMFMMCATNRTCCSARSLLQSMERKQCHPNDHVITILGPVVVDIRATTQAHTDIVDVLLSINGAYTRTVAALHDIGKATVLKMHMKECFSLSEIGDVKADKLMAKTFELYTSININ